MWSRRYKTENCKYICIHTCRCAHMNPPQTCGDTHTHTHTRLMVGSACFTLLKKQDETEDLLNTEDGAGHDKQ